MTEATSQQNSQNCRLNKLAAQIRRTGKERAIKDLPAMTAQ